MTAASATQPSTLATAASAGSTAPPGSAGPPRAWNQPSMTGVGDQASTSRRPMSFHHVSQAKTTTPVATVPASSTGSIGRAGRILIHSSAASVTHQQVTTAATGRKSMTAGLAGSQPVEAIWLSTSSAPSSPAPNHNPARNPDGAGRPAATAWAVA
ncbi:hypothetical protein [Planobispora longispora]|uniref:hypothetical protein n=1 Tax=Planobispora longispora TaxID=28887 RepID=UPI001EF69ECA|nr:hypothetical protein [Planobispora longispora]